MNSGLEVKRFNSIAFGTNSPSFEFNSLYYLSVWIVFINFYLQGHKILHKTVGT